MEWEFTPAQVVKGEVGYALEDFRRDLAREVALNLERGGDEEIRRVYDLVFDLCYWLATGKPLADLLAAFENDSATRAWLAALQPHLQANVEMLGAILQRELTECMAQGNSLDAALRLVAERHQRLAAPGAAARL